MVKELFALNPDLDLDMYAERLQRDRRVQIRDFLTDESARELRTVLQQGTAWGVAAQAGATGAPRSYRHHELQDPSLRGELQQRVRETDQASARGEYAMRCMRYSLVEGYLGKWDEGGPHDILLEHLNDEPFLTAMRKVTGIPELKKADGHAACYGPQHYLGLHIDSHVMEGWRVAYVLNLTTDNWQPDWGGYLVFYDEDGDIEVGYRPRFNSMNMFLVPQAHAVTYVPPFAPLGRYAINGWLRDR